jgi:hypothetical protein
MPFKNFLQFCDQANARALDGSRLLAESNRRVSVMTKQNHPGYHRRKRTIRQTRLSADALKAIAHFPGVGARFDAFGMAFEAPVIGDEYRPHRPTPKSWPAPSVPLNAEPFSEMPPVALADRRFPDRPDETYPPNPENYP